jgi:hypothetical protein
MASQHLANGWLPLPALNSAVLQAAMVTRRTLLDHLLA